MAEVDELDINLFFKALQTKYLAAYEYAQDHCYLICIPCTDSLHGISIDQKFVDTHLLRASPFFKGQYETKDGTKSVIYEDGADSLVPGEGSAIKDKITILNEELGYNKNDKPYKILITEKPIDSSAFRRHNLEEDDSTEVFRPKCTLKECRDFLMSYPEFAGVLKELDDSLVKFNRNYMLLKDYLDEASDRLETLTTNTTEKCLKCSRMKLWMNRKSRDMLTATVETYIMHSVHEKVYPVICNKFSANDGNMQDTYRKLTGLTADQLGVPQHFSCPLPSAVVELAHLDGLTTPIEKLYCLKTTFDHVTSDISSSLRESQPPGVTTDDIPCLTSDDLIPILVTVIIQAKCSHIHSNIYYMENFYWSAGAKDQDSLSYCLVTFKAAVQYMTSANFNQMDLQKNLAKNEISIDELMAAKWESSATSSTESRGSDSEQTRPRVSSKSRIDQQLQNITKMLEESSVTELTPARNTKPAPSSIFGASFTGFQPTPDVVPKKDPRKQREQMGDFLASLEDDMFLSYGKQT